MTRTPSRPNRHELIWNACAERGAHERHMNGLEHRYPLLASAWLLAMFGSIGFVLKEDQFVLPHGIAVACLGVAGAVGLTQPWNLYARLYHQLLNACFAEGLRLEKDYPWLPRMRITMVAARNFTTHGNSGRFSKRVALFYISGIFGALLAATAGMANAMKEVAEVDSGAALLATWASGLVVALM